MFVRIARIVVLALALTVASNGVAAGVGAAAPAHVGHVQPAEGGYCC